MYANFHCSTKVHRSANRAIYRHFYLDRLPEAICCCLQTYTVYDVLLIMYCMCLPAFFVAGADKSQLWVYTYVYAIY